jgi:hypothetical protein
MATAKNIAHQTFAFALMQFAMTISDHTSSILPSMLEHC